MYEYRAKIIEVIDGDTADVQIDMGLDIHTTQRVRLYGIDAPEKSSESGKKAKDRLTELMPVGSIVTLRTIKDRKEKFGRYLGVFLIDDLDINALMVAQEFAVPYFGGRRDSNDAN